MGVSKKTREQIFNKYNGRCAYCGCELTNKWHVDHMEPVIRFKERLPRLHKHWETGEEIEDVVYMQLDRAERLYYTAQPAKYLNKSHYPERDTIENSTPACVSCNINKGGAGVEAFRWSISNGVESLNKQHAQYKIAKRYGLVTETEKPVVFYFETITTNESKGRNPDDLDTILNQMEILVNKKLNKE